MWPIPGKYTMVAAGAEGPTRLNAFDNALLAAGIGNLNLVRVSSILPPGAVYHPVLEIPAGSLVPVAYGYIISEVPGECLAAAVGVGLSRDSFGVIMEFAGRCSAEAAREAVLAMVREAFAVRGMELVETKLAVAEHRVQRVGCALAAVPLWF